MARGLKANPNNSVNFSDLSPDTSWVLVAMLVYHDRISISVLIRLLTKANIPVRNKAGWSKDHLEIVLDDLSKARFVEIVAKGYRPTAVSKDLIYEILPVSPGGVKDLAIQSIGLLDLLKKDRRYHYYYSEEHFNKFYQLARLRLLENNFIGFSSALQELQQSSRYYSYYSKDALESIDKLFNNFHPEFWLALVPQFQRFLFSKHSLQLSLSSTPTYSQKVLAFVRRSFDAAHWDEAARNELLDLATLHLHAIEADELGSYPIPLQALYSLTQGQEAAALDIFLAHPMDKASLSLYAGLGWLLRFKKGLVSAKMASVALEESKESTFKLLDPLLHAFFVGKSGQIEKVEEYLDNLISKIQHPLEMTAMLWLYQWLGIFASEALRTRTEYLLKGEWTNTWHWLHQELRYAANLLFPQNFSASIDTADQPTADKLATWKPLTLLFSAPPAWENALQLLETVAQDKSSNKSQGEQAGLQTIWIVDFEDKIAYPKEQKMGKKGWSTGRKMKWTELISPDNTNKFEEADLLAVNALEAYDRKVYPYSNVSEDAISVSFGHLLYIIAEHPRVFMDDKKRIPLELKRSTAELSVMETEQGLLLLKFNPPVTKAGYIYRKETPTRYAVYHITEDQFTMARAVRNGVEVPAEKRSLVEQQLEGLRNKVSVQSSTDLQDLDLEELAGSTQPCVHLLPFGDAYKLEIYVKPYPEESYYFKPGDGLPRSILIREEGKFICLRNLNEEETRTRQLIDQCPTLLSTPHQQFEWQIDDTYDALKILLELRKHLEEGNISLEHPKGEKLKLVAEASSQDLSLRMGRQRDWFEVGGSLRIDENRVLDFEFLLEQIRLNNSSNFIQLANGDFMALTNELKERIIAMEGMLFQRGKKMQLPTLAAGHFAELAEGLEDVEADEAWQESLDRIKKAGDLQPEVPKEFRAELRSYQKDGYNWLARLAEWGVGACLADDMGLGKTIQALAILTSRASQGPALVIAPASVTRNWVNETNSFAPSLIPILMAGSKDTEVLSELGPGDLLLVSYGLLPFVAEELQAKEFATIVIDEAQAIKNVNTKRAKTVFQLQGDFKLATTGTPIENNLGELWSLFRFLNPGLLGSQEAFNQKFNGPISKYQDQEKQQQLQKLIKPFILRRRKDEVLKELPAKTEIVLNVLLSPEEAAFYEALRRQALKEIAETEDNNTRQFKVLAQLTKLRQAACNPKLVKPSSKIGSAKLELVQETVKEVLEGGHKILIFSQFVKHLKIVEDWVKSEGIAYQYLDGSTSGKKRQDAVEAFQAGEGDIFLISLKAGGTGLNLTEADFVFHLDPWWNPAAEDQASDRAHRIGQQRPVTVYRFVSEATIEEKIIALHKEKRDLADQLLSGTNHAGQLNVDQILELISG